MSNEKVEGSPLARRKLTLGTQQPTIEKTEPEGISSHEDIKTSKHTGVKTSSNVKRTTIYMPDDLAIRLKIYAARKRTDMSALIVAQIEKLLAEEE